MSEGNKSRSEKFCLLESLIELALINWFAFLHNEKNCRLGVTMTS